ncbi:MAG: hypothetical protein IJD83_09470 [Clostridia bacterium]|nr:hypothetical protein [Clostridia bacterium]
MGCILKYIAWALIAISIGITIALLFPITLIAGIEALLVMLLCLLICIKK